MAATKTTDAREPRKDDDDEYVPSERATLLARVYDGKARLSWDPVSPEVTDEELARAGHVLGLVLDAVTSGDHEVLEAMRRIVELRPRGVEQRKAGYLEFLARMVQHVGERDPVTSEELRRRDPRAQAKWEAWSQAKPSRRSLIPPPAPLGLTFPPSRRKLYEGIRTHLAESFDVAFERLSLEALREGLRAAKRTRVPKLGAQFAVRVNAWGLGKKSGSKAEQTTKASSDLRAARAKAKTRDR